MLRLCCCSRRAVVTPAPSPPRAHDLKLDLVADLPALSWDSSVLADYDEKDSKTIVDDVKNEINQDDGRILTNGSLPADIPAADGPSPLPSPQRSPSLHRSPSICVEDYSNPSLVSVEASEGSPIKIEAPSSEDFVSQKSEASAQSDIFGRRTPGGEVAGGRVHYDVSAVDTTCARSVDTTSSRASPSSPAASTPPPAPAESTARAPRGSRDVRTALAECILPARHEDWEAIIGGLVETERLAADPTARAPATSWRAAARGATTHVRSLRSRVARVACSTLGALYEQRGRALEPELEESAAALLERCADANRFLRADAGAALAALACGGGCARAAAALCRRGAVHRAGPVRAAAAAALARLVEREGAARALSLQPEPRALLLRAAADLLADASADARLHGRTLCLALGEDARFRPLLKEVLTPSRYRSVEKLIDKLRYR